LLHCQRRRQKYYNCNIDTWCQLEKDFKLKEEKDKSEQVQQKHEKTIKSKTRVHFNIFILLALQTRACNSNKKDIYPTKYSAFCTLEIKAKKITTAIYSVLEICACDYFYFCTLIFRIKFTRNGSVKIYSSGVKKSHCAVIFPCTLF